MLLQNMISSKNVSCMSGLGCKVVCGTTWRRTIPEKVRFRHREFVCIAAGKQGSNYAMILKKTAHAEQGGHRLDEALSSLFETLSKSEARRIIDRGGCAVNSSMVRVASRLVKVGDVIEVGVMEAGRFHELVLPPESLLYEDGELIAVNKPAGANTQRTPYQLKGTLEYWVSEYFRQQGSHEPARVIHRLDRGTSGVMLFPKHKRAAAWLSARFHDNLVEKCYWALVSGQPEQEAWTVEGAIGKVASARYCVPPAGVVGGVFTGRSASSDRAYPPDSRAPGVVRSADCRRCNVWRGGCPENDAALLIAEVQGRAGTGDSRPCSA